MLPNVQGEKASNKSPTLKQTHSESKIQDGEHFTSERHFETKQFSHQNRLKRCFLQHPYCQKVKKIPSVYLPQQTLPILCPTIRNFNSSSSVFQDPKACYCSSSHKRYISHYLSRRSTHCGRDIHRLFEPYETSNFSSGVLGFSNQLRKIHNNLHPKARILGLHNRFNLYVSCPPSRQNPVNKIASPKASENKRNHFNKTALKIHRPLHFSKIRCSPSTSTLPITSVPEKLCFKGLPILPHSVQSGGSPEPRSHNRPKVVGRPPAVSQQNTNLYKQPRSHHHIGCLRSGLGSMVREKISSRPMVSGGNVLAYKSKGASSCIFGSKNILPVSNKPVVPHSTSNRQSDSCFIYKSSGGNTLKTSLPIKSGSVELVPIKTDHISARYIPGIFNKHADHMSRRLRLTAEWKLNPILFQRIVAVYGMPQIDLFVTRANTQLGKFVSWIPDPQSAAIDTFSVQWSDPLSYAFPLFSLIMRCVQRIKNQKGKILLVTPVWRSRSWYPLLFSLLYDQPLLLLNSETTLLPPSNQKALKPQLNINKFTLAVWPLSGNASLNTKFLRVSKIIFASWRSGTESQYKSCWGKWHSWCMEREINPVSCNLNFVLEFLTDLFTNIISIELLMYIGVQFLHHIYLLMVHLLAVIHLFLVS